MTVEEIAVKITGDSTSLQTAMRSAEDSLSKFGISLDFLTKVGAGVALKKIGDAALEAAKAFAESEKQSLRLNAAISASQTIGSSGRRALDDLAASTAKLAGVDDDAVTGMEAMLVSTGRTTDEIKKMMTAALGLSNATGVDLNTALTQINSTFSGTVGRLDRMTPALKDLTEEQLKNGGAVDILLAKYGSLATALAGSSSASMANFETQLGNVQEALGSLVEVNLKPLRDGLASVFEWFVNNKPAIIAAFIAVEGAVVALVALVNPIAGIIAGLIALGSTVVTLGSQVETVTNKAIDAEIKYGKAVNDVTAGMARGEKAAFDRAHAGETAAKKAAAQAIIDDEKEKQRQAEIGKARVSAQEAYDKSIAITAEKAKAGFITQEEAARANFDANSKLINDLYNLGYTTDQKTGAVGSARLAKALADYQTQSDAFKASIGLDALNRSQDTLLELDQIKTISEAKQKATDLNVVNSQMDSLMADADKKNTEQKIDYIGKLKDAYTSLLSGPFTALGDALVKQQDIWAALGKAALQAISTIIKGFGDQLAAMAAGKLAEAIADSFDPFTAWAAPGQYTAAALLTAGAAAAYTSAGAIAAFADGTSSAPGGLSLVGERGPELVNLPTGSKVYNNSQTTSMLSQSNSKTFVFNSPAALSPVETRREFERMSRRLAFEGVA